MPSARFFMRSTMQPDSGKSGGFFRKVMHIVRGTSATEADAPPDPDSLTAREALQEVMARKRRNDAIRQQEFAQLRQLRQRNQAIGQVHNAAAEREAEAEQRIRALPPEATEAQA